MKIMYVTISLRAPNGVCASNVIEALVEAGHDVLVFAQDNGMDEVNCPCRIVHSKCQSVYVLKERFKKTKLGLKIRKVIDLLYRLWIIICYPIWPINSPHFVYVFSREAYRVSRDNQVDMVIAEYGDLACLNAGRYIKKRSGEIKAVAYFIDALYCGPKPSYMSEKTKNRLSLYWENKMLRSYDKVVMMEATKSRYNDVNEKINFYNKICYLDIPMLKPKAGNSIQIPYRQNDAMIFVYIGSLPKNIRSPQYLLDLFRSFDNAKWYLHIYGSNEYPDLVAKYEKFNIEYKGVVTHEEALKIMKDADYLVNIGNSFSEMVPSKIFEYISTGKPIISTFKIQNDPCIKYLNLYGNAVCLDENAPISVSKKQLIRFINEEKSDNDLAEHIRRVTSDEGSLYNNTPKAFLDCLEAINDSIIKV